MKLKLLFLLISFNLFAGTMPNNNYNIGDSASTADKGFTFDTGDGASNESLKVDDAKKLKFSGNTMQIGDGASVNSKELILDPASGASIKWNGTDLKLEFSNDGTNYKKIGSGSGSGGGSNYNNAFTVDQNANAEEGTTGWTASAGTFAVTATDPLEGDQSFTWIPSAQNDTLDSPVLDVDKDIFLGRSCQAQIEYIGGDENLTLQVIDADNDVLASQSLVAHSITATESIYFLCPASSATANDKDLRLRILNEGATASVLIKFDKSYVGTLIGLSETTLPDLLTAKVANDGTITSESSDWISGNCTQTLGDFACNFVSGAFSVVPSCVATVGPNASSSFRVAKIKAITATSINIQTNAESNQDANYPFHLHCSKQGADAKQSVQVYKSIPKVSENINEFSAIFQDNGTLDSQVGDIFTGNCSVSDTSLYTCNMQNLTALPVCTVTAKISSASGFIAQIQSLSLNPIVIRTKTDGAGNAASAFHITCQKQGSDFKMPTVQPVIVGQVANSYAENSSKNVRVESCAITNSGSPVLEDSSNLCSNWIDSLTDAGVGIVNFNVKAGIFSNNPNCTCSTKNGDDTCQIYSTTTSLIGTRAQVSSTGTNSDEDLTITCTGER